MKTKFMLLMLFTFMSGLSINAQETKEQKRVKIIKETIDDDGNVTREVKEAEGEEADLLMKEMEEELEDGNREVRIEKRIEKRITKKGDGEHEIEVFVNDDDGEGKIIIKAMGVDDDGEMKIIKLNADEIDYEDEEGQQKRIIIKSMDGEGNDVKIMRWYSDEDFPEGLDGEVIIDIDEEMNGNKFLKKEKRFGNKDMMFFPEGKNKMMQKDDFVNNNKASLGVMIEDTKDGVVIEDFIEGSNAEKAGLRRGDVILKVENTYIFSDTGLVNSLSRYNPNEKVKVKYLRDGKEKSVKVTLKARN